ncbi:MAG: TIM-barrel domain-containing protein, partial [Phycisphaerales bacterium]
YGAAMEAFTAFAGRVPMPRRYLLGSWYSRYWPHTSDEYRGIVGEYEAHGLPLDVVVLDMDWHREGWTGWSWNRVLLPDAEDLLKWMRARGLAVTLNLHPADGVGPHEDRYGEFMRALGRDPSGGETVAFDAGDERYMRALFEAVHRPLEESGVDFWWVDWQQQRYVPSVPGLTNLAWLNHLYFRHTLGEGAAGARGVSFSRWAGSGGQDGAGAQVWSDHRHPIHFSGDAHTGWEMLDYQVWFTVAAGYAGCFYWSHDIGGHFGPRLEETTARWVQFGALSAALRLHSARTGALDRRPWSYSPEYFGSMREAFALRARLMPYIYTQARACHERSLPLLRGMPIGWPMEAEAYRSPRQYMLGDHLLAAPITSAGTGAGRVAWREVWFPPLDDGNGWYRWGTGERYEGGTHAVVSATIEETPLFVRGGVPIPMRPPGRRMSDGVGASLVVRVWPGRPGSVGESVLYEDDGLTRGHEHGEYARTPLRVEWAAGDSPGRVRARVRVGPTVGAYRGQVRARSVAVEFAGVSGASLVNPGLGRGVAAVEDAGAGVVRFVRTAGTVEEPVELEVELGLSDADRVRVMHAARRFGAAFGWHPAAEVPDLWKAVVQAATARAAGGKVGGEGEGGADAALAIGFGVAAVVVEERPDLGRAPGLARVIDTFSVIDGGVVRVEVVDRSARSAVSRWSGEVVLECGGGSVAGGSRWGEVALPAVPLRSPLPGVRAERLLRAEFSVGGRPVAVVRPLQTLLEPIAAWRVIGPFAWNWAESITAQAGGPERGGLDEHDRHAGVGGRELEWRAGRGGAMWATDFRESLREQLGEASGLGYAVTTVISARAQRARLYLEASDKVEAWVNGEKVYSMDAFESAAALEAGADIVLKTGRNTVLVKCASGGVAGLGGWGFTARIEGEHGVGVESGRNGWGHPTAG